jgi:cyclohexanecarboxyl-CoA dehydrogenase
MTMVLDDEQQTLQLQARKFARERLLPGYLRREREGTLDRALLREMGELGLLAIDLPSEHGGLGASGLTAGIIAEELAYGDFNVASVSVIGSLLGAILARQAPPAIRAEWLPRITSGQSVVGIALTEPRGGSDAAQLQLRARRDGDHYVIDGEKTSITFSTTADAFVIFARTGKPDEGARGVSALFVPADSAGLTRTKFDDVGSRMVGRGSLFFDQVRIPAAFRLGDEGRGFSQVMMGFDFSRVLIALQCVGAAQASLDEAWAYTREREAFGAPIASYQGVTFPLVEGEAQIAAIRQLCYHCLALRDAGQRHTSEAAMCKFMGPRSSFDVIHQCLLTFGHYGWSMDSPHQQRMRDVMGLEIGDGTASIMKLIVARERASRAAG